MIIQTRRKYAMEIEFQDKTLALLLTERAAESRLPISVIKSFRNKYSVIQSAPDERTLRNWKSLHFEKLKGSMDGRYSIRLNDQWRLVFSLTNDCGYSKVIMLGIEDYH